MTIQSQLDQVLALVESANLPPLETLGGHVDSADGDTVADCYYNAAHEMDADNVAKAIAAACNFLREHGPALRAAVGGEAAIAEIINSGGFKALQFLDDSSLTRFLIDYPVGTKLYASPPATVDVGAIRGLVEKWRIRERGYQPPESVRIAVCADELAALIGEGA